MAMTTLALKRMRVAQKDPDGPKTQKLRQPCQGFEVVPTCWLREAKARGLRANLHAQATRLSSLGEPNTLHVGQLVKKENPWSPMFGRCLKGNQKETVAVVEKHGGPRLGLHDQLLAVWHRRPGTAFASQT